MAPNDYEVAEASTASKSSLSTRVVPPPLISVEDLGAPFEHNAAGKDVVSPTSGVVSRLSAPSSLSAPLSPISPMSVMSPRTPNGRRHSRCSSEAGSEVSTPKSRKKLDLIAAGHAAGKDGTETIQTEENEDGSDGSILKVLDPQEEQVYMRLAEKYAHDPINEFVPKFLGVEECADDSGNLLSFIRMSNLLDGFSRPKVIDIKLGIRTYLESECANPKLRPDLYERMCKMYPKELTDEDHKAGAITKHKFMDARDRNSTIRPLGYRIDGCAGYRNTPSPDAAKDLANLRTDDETCAIFGTFVEVAATDDGELPDDETSLEVAEELLLQMRRMLNAILASSFVKEHEFIGSSILMVADARGRAGVSWIDFAKTCKLEEGLELSHIKAWEPGNHEDGIIFGMRNLVDVWDRIVDALRDKHAGHGPSKSISSREFACHCLRLRCSRRKREKQRRQVPRSVRGSRPGTSDTAILSALPVFSGKVADKDGRIFGAGRVVGFAFSRVVQAGAAVACQAASGGNAVVEAAHTVAGAAVSGGVAVAAAAVNLPSSAKSSCKSMVSGRRPPEASLSALKADGNPKLGAKMTDEHDLGEEMSDRKIGTSAPPGTGSMHVSC